MPTFEAYAAPTQHPLYLALCALLGPSSASTPTALLVLVCLLCARRARAGHVYRLGRGGLRAAGAALLARAVRRRRAFVVPALRGARRTSTRRSSRSCCGPAALEAERPRRGRAVWRCSSLAGPAAPRGVGARRRCTGCGCRAGRRVRPARARGRRAASSGALVDLVGHRRPAVLAARDVRARRRARSACAGSAARPRRRSCPSSADTARPPVALLAPIGGVLPGGCRAGRALHVPARAVRARASITFVGTGAAGPLDPAALPDGAGGRALPVRGLRAARLHGAARGRAADAVARAAGGAAVVGLAFVRRPAPSLDQRSPASCASSAPPTTA